MAISRLYNKLLLLILALCLASPAHSSADASSRALAALPAPFAISNSGPDSADMTPHLSYQQDQTRLRNFTQIAADGADAWQTSPSQHYSIGFTESAWWFRLQLSNQSGLPQKRLLRVVFPLLDSLEVLVRSDTGKPDNEYRMGDALAFENRIIADRHFVVPIDLANNETQTLFFRVETSNTLLFPAQLVTVERFEMIGQRDFFFVGLYSGLMTFVFILTGFLFFRVGARQYAYYACYVLCVAGYNLALNGYGYQLLWPNSQWFNDRAPLFFICLSIIFAVGFCLSFLNLYQRAPLLSRILFGAAVISGVLLVCTPIMPYAVIIYMAMPLVVLSAFLITYSGLKVALSGRLYAWLFFTGWMFMSIGVTALCLNQLGWIAPSPLTSNGAFFGTTLEIIFVILAISEQLTNRAVGALANQTSETEMQYEEKRKLASKMAALEGEKEKLDSLIKKSNRLDPKTGALNHEAFSNELDKEFKTGLRHGRIISLLVIDLPGLDLIRQKRSNAVAEDYLAELTLIITSTLYRASDSVGRIDQNRLAVLLPSTEIQGCYHIITRIRAEIASSSGLLSGEDILFGVGSTEDHLARHARELLEEALNHLREI